ncbi:tumor necrosis factor receptor superfamily member 26 isoform X2 [Etheostoma spectabile]|uniref:tumor necrosis factor receptor superfamily member 26 isoform X2 n=1 Tax=Etheostoma spectabile TaxID=54343 RepID=UPI0013AEB85D|nr:tumor necrosis factor receptor superfamily member 26-like isoform X2 [Etheostoma spectabile]
MYDPYRIYDQIYHCFPTTLSFCSSFSFSQMQLLCLFAFTLLVSLSFLSAVLSISCNERQYDWPMEQPYLCCDKCPPGKHMVRRSYTTCEIECQSCTRDLFNEKYNVQFTCDFCENCDKPNMEYSSHCNATHNAVCRCKAGYRCKEQSCKQCEPIPDPTEKCKADYKCKDQSCKQCVPTVPILPFTTKPTLPASTTDTVWFLVIIALLCAGIALVVVTKIKPFLHWIKAKHSYLLAKEAVLVLPVSEDEEVSKPVQEVRGKCDV